MSFLNETGPTEVYTWSYTLSLHAALPISDKNNPESEKEPIQTNIQEEKAKGDKRSIEKKSIEGDYNKKTIPQSKIKEEKTLEKNSNENAIKTKTGKTDENNIKISPSTIHGVKARVSSTRKSSERKDKKNKTYDSTKDIENDKFGETMENNKRSAKRGENYIKTESKNINANNSANNTCCQIF